MFKNYLKISFRNLMKNKLFVFINIIGLGTALACCIVAFLNWDYNTQFDAFHADTENVYRVNFVRITNGRPIKNGMSPLPLAAEIKNTLSKVDKTIRYSPIGGNFRVNNEVFRTDVSAVDPAFFEVFTFSILHGSSDLKDKRSILISADIQVKHFPDKENPVGETLTYISGDKRIDFKVAGVFEIPPKKYLFF